MEILYFTVKVHKTLNLCFPSNIDYTRKTVAEKFSCILSETSKPHMAYSYGFFLFCFKNPMTESCLGPSLETLKTILSL